MARKKKAPPAGANNAYLISFGDTMTALLAFFIVLNSLAKEQTGADVHAGTGSFVEVTDRMGVPGVFAPGKSRYRTQLNAASPLYVVPDDEGRESDRNGDGPDEDGDSTWIRDREQEDYERFLTEIERAHEVNGLPDVTGEISFDRMARLPDAAPRFDKALRETLIPLAPRLRQSEYEVELVMWATTPSKSAWTRAATQAFELRQEVVSTLKLQGVEAARLTAVAKPWMYSDVKRPIMTVVVRKTGTARPPAR